MKFPLALALFLLPLPPHTSLALLLAPRTDPPTPSDHEWQASLARAEKLLGGMKADDAAAARLWNMRATAQSWVEGERECRAALRDWGYADDTPAMQGATDRFCDFEGVPVGEAFAEMGIDDRKSWKHGGANRCFRAVHRDGDAVHKVGLFNPQIPLDPRDQRYTVCKVEYRVTDAEFTIGVNPRSGTVYFVSRKSPQTQAARLWGRPPRPEELPAVQMSSDVAWCFWERAMKDPGGGDVRNIRHFVVTNAVNPETQRIMKRALGMDYSQWQDLKWPGVVFSTDTDEGKALLGSPNGRSAGFFLMQHKVQLGGNKYIDRVRIFMPGLPWLVFYVKDVAPAPEPGSEARMGNSIEELK